ncbi:hypothetical protein KGQ20_37115 [Catenulispora sp. NF23]|uniref:hypothetical protein n=1 Tax=Catenulispora pinistramenti TaxID=2705254 RepID=UPI001BA8BAF2|nr:hypothetical protein [Catenulispora pinistramenti]MBS2538386.1 hypothetical protein [Catenulispora pinistramenti]
MTRTSRASSPSPGIAETVTAPLTLAPFAFGALKVWQRSASWRTSAIWRVASPGLVAARTICASGTPCSVRVSSA